MVGKIQDEKLAHKMLHKMPNKRLNIKRILRLTVTHLVTLLGCAWTIIPLLWMLSTSLKIRDDIFSIPPQWIPKTLEIQNYVQAVTLIPFARYFLNTSYIAIVRLGGEVFVSAIVAYGFSRFEFKSKRFLFMMLLSTLMIPGEATILPSYIMFSKLGLINTYFPLAWASYFGGAATFIFFLRMYFTSIPKALDESAFMDGATSWQIFWKIIMPISKPALVTIGIWSFMGAWNDLLGPLLFLNSYEKYTLQLGLAMFNSLKEINWGALMAASVLALVPPLIVFFLGQKRLVEGIKMSGIKG